MGNRSDDRSLGHVIDDRYYLQELLQATLPVRIQGLSAACFLPKEHSVR
jgi:hypothetical protein